MKKSDINPLPKYFDRYINLIDDIELDLAFENSLKELSSFDRDLYQRIGLQVYEPGKWTVPDVLQHLLDWERIMTYRALIFARQAGEKAVGHDENIMAQHTNANQRSISELLGEMTLLRQTTRIFFRNLTDEQLQHSGISYDTQMSALALGFTILGHQRHHFNILEERYMPLQKNNLPD